LALTLKPTKQIARYTVSMVLAIQNCKIDCLVIYERLTILKNFGRSKKHDMGEIKRENSCIFSEVSLSSQRRALEERE
jgi:hypothetical protein